MNDYPPNHNLKRLAHGFTLIELLAVIAIIAILGGILILTLSGILKKELAVESVSNLRDMYTAANLFFGDHGYYPDAALTGGTYGYWNAVGAVRLSHQRWPEILYDKENYNFSFFQPTQDHGEGEVAPLGGAGCGRFLAMAREARGGGHHHRERVLWSRQHHQQGS